MGKENVGKFIKKFDDIVKNIDVKAIIMAGLCGAADKSLSIGDVLIYENISMLELLKDKIVCTGIEKTGFLKDTGLKAGTTNFLVSKSCQKVKIFNEFNIQAVDMETYYIARFALRKAIPFAAIRAVSDTADQDLPDFFMDFSTGRKFSGTINMAKYILKPSNIKHLAQTYKGIKTALCNLTKVIEKLPLN